MHADPASPQLIPSDTWFGWQIPAPLQVSALSQEPLDGSPQAVPAGAGVTVQVEVPLQLREAHASLTQLIVVPLQVPAVHESP